MKSRFVWRNFFEHDFEGEPYQNIYDMFKTSNIFVPNLWETIFVFFLSKQNCNFVFMYFN